MQQSLLTGSLTMIRHGQTDWNKAGKMQGVSDIPLNDLGREQARQTGLALADKGLVFDVLVSSPLSRAFETAQLVGKELGLAVSQTYAALVERNYGQAEGLDIPPAARKEPDAFYEGVESERSLFLRGVQAARQLVEQYPGQRILAVSHGSLIRRLLCAAQGEPWLEPVPHAQPLEIPLPGLFAWRQETEPLLQGKP